jgi:serine/threonine protein kinase
MLHSVSDNLPFLNIRIIIFKKTKGSCTDLLSAHSFGVREQLIAHIMWQLLQALRYLQDRYILHR